MGGKSSKEGSWRSNSSNWGQTDYNQPSYNQPSYTQGSQSYQNYDEPQMAYPSYAPQQPYQQPPQNYESRPNQPQKKLDRRYSRIADNYTSLEQVTEALARAGLESSNLIVGIDFTKSNEWTGSKSYNRRSLHHIGDSLNPYEQAISIIGKTLAAFDEDNLIPCYGFGDASTHDQDVFSFYPEERFCNGFEEVLSRYREIVPQLRLAGPTSFAPVIEMATTIVQQSGGQYHVLLIIADGQVTRSVDTDGGRLSPQEQKTVDAIVKASKFPLSIILVGVGDGPWDMMKEFDDNIPARDFDNFQFVNFTEIMSKNVPQLRKETEFALSALMEIPIQYKATIELNISGGRKGNAEERMALPPPVRGGSSFTSSKPSRATSFQQRSSSYDSHSSPVSNAPPALSSTSENQMNHDLMDTIWVISSVHCRSVGIKTGVGIKNDRILTCHHGFGKQNFIEARRVRDDQTYIMDIEHDGPNWDLSILRFRSAGPPNFKYLNLSDNEVLAVGEELCLIGHGNQQIASTYKGRVVQPCIRVDPSSFDDEIEFPDYGDDEVPYTREYSVLGDHMESDDTYYSPNIPSIETFSFESTKGSSGGPYIRNREIIGTHIGCYPSGFDYGVHVSALKEFVRQADEKERAKTSSSASQDD